MPIPENLASPSPIPPSEAQIHRGEIDAQRGEIDRLLCRVGELTVERNSARAQRDESLDLVQSARAGELEGLRREGRVRDRLGETAEERDELRKTATLTLAAKEAAWEAGARMGMALQSGSILDSSLTFDSILSHNPHAPKA